MMKGVLTRSNSTCAKGYRSGCSPLCPATFGAPDEEGGSDKSSELPWVFERICGEKGN